jgi:hypothetical protein
MSQRQQSLQLERLEDRCLPTTNFFWSGGLGLGSNPNWESLQNWRTASGPATRLPGSGPDHIVALIGGPTLRSLCVLNQTPGFPLAGLSIQGMRFELCANLHDAGYSVLDTGGGF